jgi:hypothetical protein
MAPTAGKCLSNPVPELGSDREVGSDEGLAVDLHFVHICDSKEQRTSTKSSIDLQAQFIAVPLRSRVVFSKAAQSDAPGTAFSNGKL